MTENKKELLLSKFNEYKEVAKEICKQEEYDHINFRGRQVDIIKILIDLDKNVEIKEEVEEKEDRPTTKKK